MFFSVARNLQTLAKLPNNVPSQNQDHKTLAFPSHFCFLLLVLRRQAPTLHPMKKSI